MKDRAAKPIRFGSRLALLVGFGGVLLLMALAGMDSISIVHLIEASQAEQTRIYLAQHRALGRMRTGLYLSGNAVREYLEAADPRSAEAEVARLRQIREEMDAALHDSSLYAQTGEKDLFGILRVEVERYWNLVDPIIAGTLAQKGGNQSVEIAQRLEQHQAKLLEISDNVDAATQQAVDASNARSAEQFNSYRRRIGVALFVGIGLALVLAGASVKRILGLENEARLRYEEIVRTRAKLEELSARLVAAQEEERRTISRELHDETGQALSALQVDLGNLGTVVPETHEEAHRLIKAARSLAAETLNSIRNMALLLRPSMLDDFGLAPALEWQAREESRRSGMRVDVEADGVSDDLSDERKTCVYRIVQEALHNASRHSGAKRVNVTAVQDLDRLVVTVGDNGNGFDPARTRGLGLLGMEERVRHLGGAFEVESSPGNGATIRVELPLGEDGGAAKETT